MGTVLHKCKTNLKKNMLFDIEHNHSPFDRITSCTGIKIKQMSKLQQGITYVKIHFCSSEQYDRMGYMTGYSWTSVKGPSALFFSSWYTNKYTFYRRTRKVLLSRVSLSTGWVALLYELVFYVINLTIYWWGFYIKRYHIETPYPCWPFHEQFCFRYN